MTARDISLTVNGEIRRANVMPRMTLVDLLRDVLALTGTHIGCEHGVCGACSILLDGVPVRSCLIFAVQADGHEVTTVEGLADGDGEIGDLQGRVLGVPRHAVRLLHAGDADCRPRAARREPRAGYRGDPRGDLGQSLPLHRLHPDRRGDRTLRGAAAGRAEE